MLYHCDGALPHRCHPPVYVRWQPLRTCSHRPVQGLRVLLRSAADAETDANSYSGADDDHGCTDDGCANHSFADHHSIAVDDRRADNHNGAVDHNGCAASDHH